MSKRLNYKFIDNSGEKATMNMYCASAQDIGDTAFADFFNALKDLSEAKVYAVLEGIDNVEGSPGSAASGPYSKERSTMTLEFTSALTARTVEINVPAPDESYFNADDDLIIPTDTTPNDGVPDAIAAAITAITTNCKDAHGGTLVFKRAYRGKDRKRSSATSYAP